jgi:hypothetical protein
MDKLDFFENMEPYEETSEAAMLLAELASVPGQKYESIIKPSEIIKAHSVSSKVLSPSQEITESDSDEEIVTAQVEYAGVQNISPIVPEPIKPFFADDEEERFDASVPQLELPSIIDDSSAEFKNTAEETSSVMHTLDSQQQYAKEIVTTDDAVKELKQMTVEDFYYNENQEPAKFEEQMVIEHTLPKIDFNQYLKEDDDIAPLVTPEVFKPSIESEEKTPLKTDKAKTVTAEPSAKAMTEGEGDYAYDPAQSDTSKFVLDLPLETPPHTQEDFYMIDQETLQGSEDTAEKYDADIIRAETIPESGKEYIADSFRDTDSYKISKIVEKEEIIPALPDESSSSYTEITLNGEIPGVKAAEATRTETKSDDSIAADENMKKKEFVHSEDDKAPALAEEERKISAPSMIESNIQNKNSAINIKPLKIIKYEPEEQILEEKAVSVFPVSKEISFDSVKEKEKHFLTESKTKLDAFSEYKSEQNADEPLDTKASAPSGVEIDKLIAPDVSSKSQISSDLKKIEFPPIEAEREKQAEKEYVVPTLLPIEESKIKTVFKDSKKFQEAQLPPFESRKESQVPPELEIPPKEDKPEQSVVNKKETVKDKEELEDYEKVLAEAQKEAEEFIKDRIKKKQEEVKIPATVEARQEDSGPKLQEGMSFSDFLAKVKSQADEEELKFKKSTDSQIPSAFDDHPLRPALDTPHVPEDIARMLPIIKPDSADRSRKDLPLESSAAEIEDLKYRSVPLNIADKEEPAKEPKLKSLFSRLIKKKDKGEKIE